MNKFLGNLLFVSPVFLSIVISGFAGEAMAEEAPANPEANQNSQVEISALLPVSESAATHQSSVENTVLDRENQLNKPLFFNEEKLALKNQEKAEGTPENLEAEKLAPIPPENLQETTASNLELQLKPEPKVQEHPIFQPITLADAITQSPVKVQPTPRTDPIIPASSASQPLAPALQPSDSMSQVTSVSQLSDVQPTDWAFQALQSLVERYGCIAGYPDGTYRGNRALTRYEFAAGLNACLDQITRQIGGATANYITKEDLAILQRLQEEFAAELATLRGRVDALEARTNELESNQFSTTTKLVGDIIMVVGDTFGARANNTRANDTKDESQTLLGYRVRLDLQTSFTGRDLLTTRLISLNIPNLANTTGTNLARFGPDTSTPTTNFSLDRLLYRFPVGKANIYIAAKGLTLDTIAPTINPLDDPASGVLSKFGLRNPTVFRGPVEGTGGAVVYQFNRALTAQLGYVADQSQASNPAVGNGLFNGSYSAIAQLTFTPSRQLNVGLTYVHKYYTTNNVNVTASTGSNFANRPFGQNATTSDNLGLALNWKVTPRFYLGGWFGYTLAYQQQGGDNEATILNGALTLAFPDLFAKGNLGGILIGVPPKVTDNNFQVKGVRQEDKDTSLHIEAFYRIQVNDFISVTPLFYVITNPEHNANNAPIWVGALRTTFRF